MKTKAFLLVLLFSATGCVSVKNLPMNPSPYVAQFMLVKDVKRKGKAVVPEKFKDKIGKRPVVFTVLKNAEGKNEVEFLLYRKGKLEERHRLRFGKEGEYYGEVTLWQGLLAEEEGKYILIITVNGSPIWVKEFEIKPSGTHR